MQQHRTLEMAKPVVFVIGASGNIGQATIQALSSKYADILEIRAGVRNPDKADKLKLPGVTIVQAQMGDKDTLINTFKGVDALYIVTPGTENRAALTIHTAETAKEAGVKFILVVSLPTTGFTDTIFGRQFTEIETKVSQFGVPYSLLRLPFFVENNWGFKDSIKNDSTIYSPVDPTKPFTNVVVDDAGKAGAVILANYTKHFNTTYTISSDRYTYDDLAKTFSEALGREIKYVRIPYEAAKQAFLKIGFEEWRVDGLLKFFKLIDNDSTVTNHPDLSVYKTLTGEEPTSIKSWVSKHAGAFK